MLHKTVNLIKKITVTVLAITIMLICSTTSVFARENAYIATFFDDTNLKWSPVVMTSSDEIEKKYITASCIGGYGLEFMQSPAAYNGFSVVYDYGDGRSSSVKMKNNLGEFEAIWKKDTLTETEFYDYSKTLLGDDENDAEAVKSAPLTFPPTEKDANASDINRAYVVSTNLGNSLNEALVFLNDGKSFSNGESNSDYFMQLTYLLLSAGKSDNETTIKNKETGKVYGIAYGKKPASDATLGSFQGYSYTGGDSDDDGNYCYIKCFGKLNNDGTIDTSQASKWNKFMYRMRKGYYYDEILTNDDVKNVRKSVESKMEPDNGNATSFEKDKDELASEIENLGSSPFKSTEEIKSLKNVFYFNDKGDDGTINSLEHNKLYSGDSTYVNWFQMCTEAMIYKSMGITYNNQDDLLSISDSEGAIVSFCRKTLNGFRTILGTYSIEQLVFNDGIRGTLAFNDGIYPSSWSRPIFYFYIICSSIALALVTIAIAKMAIERNISTAIPSIKITMMSRTLDLLLAIAIIAFMLPIIYITTDLSASVVKIFANSSVTGRFKSLQDMSNNTGVLAGVIIQFAYFILVIYFNFVYIVRGIIIALLTGTAPLFIVGMSFGNKGKDLAKAWVSEFVGNLLIQPVHAAVLGFLMSVNTGLRGIEAIVFIASIIPITNMVKSIFSKGGGVASTLGAQLAGTSVSMGVAASGAAIGTVGGVAGAAATTMEDKFAGKGKNSAGSWASDMGSEARMKTLVEKRNSPVATKLSNNAKETIKDAKYSNTGMAIHNIDSKTVEGMSASRLGLNYASRLRPTNVLHTGLKAVENLSSISQGSIASTMGAGTAIALAGASGPNPGMGMMSNGLRQTTEGVSSLGGGLVGTGLGTVTAKIEDKVNEGQLGRISRNTNGNLVVRSGPRGTACAYRLYPGDVSKATLSSDKSHIDYTMKAPANFNEEKFRKAVEKTSMTSSGNYRKVSNPYDAAKYFDTPVGGKAYKPSTNDEAFLNAYEGTILKDNKNKNLQKVGEQMINGTGFTNGTFKDDKLVLSAPNHFQFSSVSAKKGAVSGFTVLKENEIKSIVNKTDK